MSITESIILGVVVVVADTRRGDHRCWVLIFFLIGRFYRIVVCLSSGETAEEGRCGKSPLLCTVIIAVDGICTDASSIIIGIGIDVGI